MKKLITYILIFAFTVQISTPSFAQQTTNTDFANFTLCMNQLSNSGKIFKAGEGQSSDRLNMMKGLLAVLLESDESNIRTIFLNADTTTTATLTVVSILTAILANESVNSLKKLRMDETTKNTKKLIETINITVKTMNETTQTIIPLHNQKKMNIIINEEAKIIKNFNDSLDKKIKSSTRIQWIAVASIAVFGALTYLRLQAHKAKKVGQNNQGVSPQTLLTTTNELAFTQQLTSNSKSAKDILSKANKGCQKILAEVRSYQQDPDLFYQELEAHKM